MYFESFIIVLVASALSAAPTAENDPKELMMKCCEDLNMEPEKLGEIFTVDDFCLDENARSFSDCFLQKMGMFDVEGNLLRWDSHEPCKNGTETEESNQQIECALKMINLDVKKDRPCTMFSCISKSGGFKR